MIDFSGAKPPKNQTVSDPSMKDLLDLHKREILLSMNCHQIGIIDEFDPESQTAKISIPYKKTFFKKSAFTDEMEPYLVEYPPIIDCPVIFLGGGLGSLRFPVKKGDECLLLFNDRDIDNWFEGSTSGATASLRLHSYSDAIALVGIRSKLKKLKNFDPDKTQLVHGEKIVWTLGDTTVSFLYNKDENTPVGYSASDTGAQLAFGSKTLIMAGPAKLTLKNDTKNIKVILTTLIEKLVELNGKINELVSATAAITVPYASPGGPAVAGPPANAAAINAVTTGIAPINSALNTIKSDIGALFE